MIKKTEQPNISTIYQKVWGLSTKSNILQLPVSTSEYDVLLFSEIITSDFELGIQ